MLRLTRSTRAPAAPKVLVLTMTPNGGALTPALRLLGFNPYVFENTYRLGNANSHTKEWRAVLMRQKPFDPIILAAPAAATAGSPSSGDTAAAKDFDALVGPPATLAYEAILRTCPRSTRVVLVEEPDKVAWEKEYEQLLQPMLAHASSRGRFLGIMADLHRMMDSMTELRRAVSVQKKPNTSASAAQNVGALQASALKLGSALDLFEAQVKETIPRDRLLVYRVGEGWGPLCAFLGVPVPTQQQQQRHDANGATNTQTVPFPPHDSGATVFIDLRERLHGADRAAFVVFVMVCSLGLVLVLAFNTPVKRLLQRYHARFNEILLPYFEQHAKQDGKVSLRDALKLSKKATMDFEAEVRREGGVVTGFKDAVNALANPYGGTANATDEKAKACTKS